MAMKCKKWRVDWKLTKNVLVASLIQWWVIYQHGECWWIIWNWLRTLDDNDDGDYVDMFIRLWNAFTSADGDWIVFPVRDMQLVWSDHQLKMLSMPWCVQYLCICHILLLHHHLLRVSLLVCCTHTHTHTHNHFMALLDFVWDYPGAPALER